MSCNAVKTRSFYFTPVKTYCMVFNPVDKSKAVTIISVIPSFLLNSTPLKFVSVFKYLGYVIETNFRDDVDISQEIRNLYVLYNFCSDAFIEMLTRSQNSLASLFFIEQRC